MICSDAQEVLSAYYDGELPDDLKAQVSTHLAKCPECARRIATFGGLSTMAAALNSPEPPEQLWSEIAKQLDESTLQVTSKRQKWLLPRYLAMAASVLIAVAIGWYAVGTRSGHGKHAEFAAEFGHYLEQFHSDPDTAQQFLLAKYEGQAVTAAEAARRVGYRPVEAAEMPDGFSLESTYVMSMPCCKDMDSCTCVQTVCRRADGSMIAIFEHGGVEHREDRPELFGDLPMTMAQCGGKACSLVHLDERIAASWMRGARHITVIGARNIEEIDQLAAALN